MQNNKLNSVLNFLSVALLAVSLPLTLYIVRSGNLDFRISAFESEDPKQITITDISNSSYRVSWITEKPVYGSVKSISSLQPIVDSVETSYHSLEVKNLNPGSDYSFQLLSGGTLYDTVYRVRTSSNAQANNNRWIVGQIFAKDGIKTQSGGIVTLKLKIGSTESQLASAVINETGGYKINVASLLTNDLQKQFPWQQKVDLVLGVYTEFDQEPIMKTFTMDLVHETQVPNVYLGDINIDIIPGVPGN